VGAALATTDVGVTNERAMLLHLNPPYTKTRLNGVIRLYSYLLDCNRIEGARLLDRSEWWG